MKKLIILVLIIIVGVIIAYNYIYQDHRDIESEKSEFSLTSTELSNEFSTTQSESEKKYLNKTIEVIGTISELNQDNMTLNNTIVCLFNNLPQQSLAIDLNVKIKGRFIGYDDLLEQIKLDQCTVTINK